jgi:hypothetical protein
MKTTLLLLTVLLAAPGATPQSRAVSWDPLLDTLQTKTLRWFLAMTDSTTGLTPDRAPRRSPSSIAAIGFALTAYPIAAERGIITRRQAARRVLTTLRVLYDLPQGPQPQGVAGYRGLFYHFLRPSDKSREWNCELSTIDTGLLMAGVLFCQSYFDRATQREKDIRWLADKLYRRVDWTWVSENRAGMALSWYPERGMEKESWHGYNESMIMYILGFGSPTHPAPASGWEYWTSTYVWGEYFGQEFVNFGPLFGHQYSHCWIDFRGIQDAYMRARGIDYFENSRRATISQRLYAKSNAGQWRGYADSVWGWTACDGPGDTSFAVDGRVRRFHDYSARGMAFDWILDDGTIAPTAASSSLPFAPAESMQAIRGMRRAFAPAIWREYGFPDSFNPSFVTTSFPGGWFAADQLGIDQGPIVLMIENHRNGLVWETMKRNPYVVAGLRRAGFAGGWLAATGNTK